jgi:hypothetical protein
MRVPIRCAQSGTTLVQLIPEDKAKPYVLLPHPKEPAPAEPQDLAGLASKRPSRTTPRWANAVFKPVPQAKTLHKISKRSYRGLTDFLHLAERERATHAKPDVPTVIDGPFDRLARRIYKKLGRADNDELGHSADVMANQAKQVADKHFSDVMVQFQKEAQLMQHDPVAALSTAVLPDGGSSFYLAMGLSAVVAPLAIMAIRTELREIEAAREKGIKLEARSQAQQELSAQFEAMLAAASGDTGALLGASERLLALLEAGQHLSEVVARDLKFAMRQAKLEGQFSKGSALSGAAILSSLGLKVATQLAVVGAAGGTSKVSDFVALSALATTGGATAAGAAAVLSLVAGGAGLYFGDRARKKTGRQRRRLRARSVPARIYLEAVAQHQETDAGRARMGLYSDFFKGKSEQREKFYRSYHRLNKVFEAGAAVYTASAATKVAVLGAVLIAGPPIAAALAQPPILALILATAAVGGVTMVVGSGAFVTGHRKDHRYQDYFLANHPKLDREFLVGVDAMQSVGASPESGAKLRAHLFEALHEGENCRQDFLQTVAKQCGKYQKRKAYSTDTPEAQPDTSSYGNRAIHKKRLLAGARAGLKMVRHASVAQAKAHHADKVDRLTPHALERWTEQPGNFTDQIDYMCQQLATDHDYQEHKSELREKIFPVKEMLAQIAHFSPEQPAPAQDDKSGEDIKGQLLTYLQAHEKAAVRDLTLNAQMQVLGFELRGMKAKIAQGEAVAPQAMALARKRFMLLQMGARYDAGDGQADTEKSAGAFAQFLQRDMPNQYKYLRGSLIETEMQVAALHAAAEHLCSA